MACNAGTELTCISNIEDHVKMQNMPVLPYILHRCVCSSLFVYICIILFWFVLFCFVKFRFCFAFVCFVGCFFYIVYLSSSRCCIHYWRSWLKECFILLTALSIEHITFFFHFLTFIRGPPLPYCIKCWFFRSKLYGYLFVFVFKFLNFSSSQRQFDTN